MRHHRWLATVLALGLVVGGCMTELEPTRQPPSPLEGTLAPSVHALPSASTVTAGVVAYAKAGGIWVTDTDGADDRQLVAVEPDPEKPPQLNARDVQYPMAWSPDGSRLYYRFERVEVAGPDDIGTLHTGLAMTDATGSKPVELLDVASPRRQQVNPLCPAPVEFNNCQANLEGAAISADGTRLAYTIQEGRELNVSSIVVLDVDSGRATRLPSTRTRNPGSLPNEGPNEPCTPLHGGYNEGLQWSPDGTRLVFTRFDCHNGVFTVNADDTDLRELGQPGVPALYPRWSPDGATITFHVATSDGTTIDVFTVQSDGTDLQALTNDGISLWPHWTRGGRIVFVRWTQPQEGLGDLWIMDADGANAAPVEATIPALTAAGCTVCPYPDDQGHFWADGGLNVRLWQPTPGH